jgi:hypothetical protein
MSLLCSLPDHQKPNYSFIYLFRSENAEKHRYDPDKETAAKGGRSKLQLEGQLTRAQL